MGPCSLAGIIEKSYLETLLRRWCYVCKFFSAVMSYYYDNNDNGNT